MPARIVVVLNDTALAMPARIVVVLNDTALADATVEALKASGYDTLAVHDSMEALTLLEGAKGIELLVTSANFAAGRPNGLAIARMTQSKRPQLRVIFVGPPELASDLAEVGYLIPEPVSAPRIAETVRAALPA